MGRLRPNEHLIRSFESIASARIVRFHGIGGQLSIENSPIPMPGAGEVRLRIKALGLNRVETLFRKGIYFSQPIVPSKNWHGGRAASVRFAFLDVRVTQSKQDEANRALVRGKASTDGIDQCVRCSSEGLAGNERTSPELACKGLPACNRRVGWLHTELILGQNTFHQQLE